MVWCLSITNKQIAMSFFWEGLKIGLILCFLLGPIFFTLVQTSVEEGFKAGAIVGLGIWVSDILFVAAVYWGISYVIDIMEWQDFSLWLGWIGGVILFSFGLGSLLSKPDLKAFKQVPARTSSIFTLFSKGVLVNSVNPFTVFFWIGISSTFIVKGALEPRQAFLFFSGILITIIVTDLLKVVLAKSIRKKLEPKHVLWIRRISGLALIIFGIALVLRVTTGDLPVI